MFRRSGKNQDTAGGLFMDEGEESIQKLFEPTKTRPLSVEQQAEGWQAMKTTQLPHHFEQMLAEEAPETTLGAGVTFRGQLSFERFLRIDGSFEGELLSQGKVVVGPTGKVKADLNLREAIIEGEVVGNITVQERLELRGQASIIGDIQASALCVDEGVSIQGHLLVGPPKEKAES